MADLIRLIREGSRRFAPVPTGMANRGRIPRAPRAVLFDVYGTLLARVGDEHPHPAARQGGIETLIARHGLGVDTPRLTASLRKAITEEHSRLRASGTGQPEVRIEAVWDRLFPGRPREELHAMIIEYELAVHPVWPMPGGRSLLSALRHRGMLLGIVSNAQFYTPIFLEALLGDRPETIGFSPSLCLYSCDFAVAKPDPMLFGAARERLHALGVAPEEALMIGNSMNDDIMPASKGGFMTALAALDARAFDLPKDISPEEEADAVVSRLSQVEELIEERLPGSAREPGQG